MKPRTPLALLAPLLAAASALALGSAPTEVASHEGYPVGGQVLIPRFDPALGELASVRITVHLQVHGGLGFENTSSVPNLVAASFGAYAEVLAPGGAQLVEAVTPPLETEHALPPFDGTVDLAGPSGVSFPGLASVAVASRTLAADPVWVAGLVSQEGPIALSVETHDTTAIHGTGRLVVRRAQVATAAVVVEYEYAPGED